MVLPVILPERRAMKRPPKSRLKSKAGRKLHLDHEEELQRSRDLKRRFRAAHGLGESALKDRDYKRLGMAIRAESQIIEAHKRLITKAQRRAYARFKKIMAMKGRTKS